MKKIGLLGCMSNLAADFYLEKLVERMPKMKQKPFELIADLEANLRLGQLLLEAKHVDQLAEETQRLIKWFEVLGVELIVIPSLSLHVLANFVQRRTRIPLLRMDDCLVKYCAQLESYRRIAILSTEAAGGKFMPDLRTKISNLEGHEVLPVDWFTSFTLREVYNCDVDFMNSSDGRQVWYDYFDAVYDFSNKADAIIVGSVEMTKLFETKNQIAFTWQGRYVPRISVVDIHMEAIAQACLT